MPFIFLGSGLVLVLVALNGDPAKLYSLIAGDFQGPNNFVYWVMAILILGALGYIPGLEKLSKLFLILIVLALLLTRNPKTGEAAGVTFTNMFQSFVSTATGTQTKAPGASTGS